MFNSNILDIAYLVIMQNYMSHHPEWFAKQARLMVNLKFLDSSEEAVNPSIFFSFLS